MHNKIHINRYFISLFVILDNPNKDKQRNWKTLALLSLYLYLF